MQVNVVQRLARVLAAAMLIGGFGGAGSGCAGESPGEAAPLEMVALRAEALLDGEQPKICELDGTACQPLEAGTSFTPPVRLETERGGRLAIELEGWTTLEVDERALVTLTRDEIGYVVTPLRGRVTLRSEPADREAAGRVVSRLSLAGHLARLGEDEAVIAVEADDADRATVTLRRGQLEMGDDDVVLHVGQTARVVRDQAIDRRAALTGETAPVAPILVEDETLNHESPRGMGRMTARVPGTNNVVSGVRLVSHSVEVTIRDGLARTEVVEEFHNDTAQVLEGRFVFPLPPDASISRLALWVDERLVEGEMLERKRAARIFKGIVDDTVRPRDPALLEWVRGSEFSLKIFPIAPKKSRRVLLAYNQALTSDGGRMRYRYPLSLGSERATLVDAFSIHVTVADSALQPADVRTPIYPADIRSEGETTSISYAAERFSPALSFDVEFDVDERAASAQPAYYLPDREQARLQERTETGDASAYVALRVRATLPPDAAPPSFEPRDRAFVIDTSHSQSRSSFEAQAALAVGLLERMDADERFVVLACDSACDSYPSSGLAPARRAAIESVALWLQRRELRGASDVAGALVAAARRLGNDRASQLIYLGDGTASAGELGADRIAERVAAELRGRRVDLRLVSVGHSIDAQVLQRVATSAGGTFEAIAPAEVDETRVDEVALALRAPVVESPVLELPSHMTEPQPARLPNLRLGQDVIVVAKLLADAGGDVVLRGRLQGSDYRVTKSVARSEASNPLVPRLWAQRQIAALQGSEDADAIAQTVALSVEHHVMSRHTALLVLENEQMFREFGIRRTQAGGATGASAAPTAPWGRDDAMGTDPLQARGNMWGDDIGDSMGAGGLGLSGIGAGGGGKGEGIGLGSIGIIGHGAGTSGTGQGFGSGFGRLGRSHRARPPRVRMGASNVSGRLPPEVIQRIVRQNFGRFRLCYENGLKSSPNLQGRVTVRFVIGRDGSVSNVAGASDMPDQGVISCVTRAFYGLSFPQPEGGIVTVSYPIVFSPGGDSSASNDSPGSWRPAPSLREAPRVTHMVGDERWRRADAEALMSLRSAAQREPQSRRAHESLIRGLLTHGALEEALDAATRFSTLDPDLPRGYELLAYAAAAIGDGQLAAMAMATWTELDPLNQAAQRAAARGFDALGQRRRACAHWTSLFEMDDSDVESKRATLRCRDDADDAPASDTAEGDKATAWFHASLECDGQGCPTLIVIAPDGAVYSPWTSTAKMSRSTAQRVLVSQHRSGTYRTLLVGAPLAGDAKVAIVADGSMRKLTVARRVDDNPALAIRTVASSQVKPLGLW